jgi:hypothetical protein
MRHERNRFGIAIVNIFVADSTRLAADTADMAQKPEPPKPTRWIIYRPAARQEQLGTIEAPDETPKTMSKLRLNYTSIDPLTRSR